VTPTRLKVNIAIGLGLIALALILDPFIDGGIWQRIIVGIAALGAAASSRTR